MAVKNRIKVLLLSALIGLGPFFAIPIHTPVFAANKNTITIVTQDTNNKSSISNMKVHITKNNSPTLHFYPNSGIYTYAKNGTEGNVLTTNSSGKLFLQELPEGEYNVKYENTDSRYITQINNGITFNVGNRNQTVVVPLIKNSGGTTLTALFDDTGTTASNLTFRINTSTGEPVLFSLQSGKYICGRGSREIKTNRVGMINLQNLPSGTYQVIQVTPVTGYQNATQKILISPGTQYSQTISIHRINSAYSQTFTSSAPTKEIKVPNNLVAHTNPFVSSKTQQYGNLKIHVQDKFSKQPVSGYTFEILNSTFTQEQDKSYMYAQKAGGITSFKTDKNGNISISHLPSGIIKLRQVNAAHDYILDTGIINQTIKPNVTNTYNCLVTPSGSGISVCDIKNEGIPKVKLEIYDNKNHIVLAGETDSTGVLEVSGLSEGTYEIKVKSVPSGFLKKQGTIPMHIGFNGKIIGLKPIKLDTSDVIVQSTAKRSGFSYTLYCPENRKVYTTSSDKNGKATFKKVNKGNYVLSESAVPSGYICSTKKFTVIINDSYTHVQTISFQESPKINQSKTNQKRNTISSIFPKNVIAIILLCAGAAIIIVVLVAKKKHNSKVQNQTQNEDNNGNNTQSQTPISNSSSASDKAQSKELEINTEPRKSKTQLEQAIKQLNSENGEGPNNENGKGCRRHNK